MSMQTQTVPVIPKQAVLKGLDNLSHQILAVIRSEPDMSEALEIKLREVDRAVSGLYCAVLVGQLGEQGSDSVAV